MAVSSELVQRVQARVGTVIHGKWRLDRVIGIGGMAAVYCATHRNQNRVALKMLHPELSIDEGVRSRFQREGYVANMVGHPGAVSVFDDDVTDDGAAFLVMELLQGETLEDRATRRGGTLPPGEVLFAANQLLEVLIAAHARGIVHRDIKPENLFLTTDGMLKVLDFGIARLREFSADDTRTGVGTFMGTPAFMAPEQARGRWDEVDARSDIWALGALMYTLLSGRNVHEAETMGEQLVLAATERASSLSTRMPELPAPIVWLVDKALAYDKKDRWADATLMQAKMREALVLVDAPQTLSAPRISTQSGAGDRSLPPPGQPPPESVETRPTGTAAAITSSAPLPATSSRQRTIALALAVAALISLVIALVVLSRADRATTEPSQAEPVTPTSADPHPPSARPGSFGSKPHVAPAASPKPNPPPAPESSTEPSAKASTPKRKAIVFRPGYKPSPSGTPSGASPPVKPNQDNNPFDRRY